MVMQSLVTEMMSISPGWLGLSIKRQTRGDYQLVNNLESIIIITSFQSYKMHHVMGSLTKWIFADHRF